VLEHENVIISIMLSAFDFELKVNEAIFAY